MSDNKKCKPRGDLARRLMPAPIVALLAVVGCAAPQAQSPTPSPSADETIKVFFQGKCPRYVNKFDLPLGVKSKKIVEWEAWKLDGSERDEDREYSVIFDPFAGKTIKATSKGLAKSNALKDEVPKNVFFKYTIVSDEDENCPPLDPFIRIF